MLSFFIFESNVRSTWRIIHIANMLSEFHEDGLQINTSVVSKGKFAGNNKYTFKLGNEKLVGQIGKSHDKVALSEDIAEPNPSWEPKKSENIKIHLDENNEEHQRLIELLVTLDDQAETFLRKNEAVEQYYPVWDAATSTVKVKVYKEGWDKTYITAHAGVKNQGSILDITPDCGMSMRIAVSELWHMTPKDKDATPEEADDSETTKKRKRAKKATSVKPKKIGGFTLKVSNMDIGIYEGPSFDKTLGDRDYVML